MLRSWRLDKRKGMHLAHKTRSRNLISEQLSFPKPSLAWTNNKKLDLFVSRATSWLPRDGRHILYVDVQRPYQGSYSLTDRRVRECLASLQRPDDPGHLSSLSLPAPVCTAERRPRSGLVTHTVSLGCEVFADEPEFHNHRRLLAVTETIL